MFELVFLGTSASAPGIYRGLPAQMVMAGEHRFLIDCGEGTQRQILQSGLGFKRLHHILLTHGHLDHILGLGGLLSTLTRWETLDEIHIWAGNATLERVRNLIFGVVFPGNRPPMTLKLHAITPGLIFEDRKFSLNAFAVSHQGPDNLGFVFQERTHRPFLPEKAEALGIPAGPVRARLVAGESVTLADGRTVHPDEVLGEAIPGVRYVHVGDCATTENLAEVANGADCLVMEATYLAQETEIARQFGHLTAADAAQLARQSNARTLILTHLSRRNRESDVRREAQAIFSPTFVARDFDHFVMARGRPVIRRKEMPVPDETP